MTAFTRPPYGADEPQLDEARAEEPGVDADVLGGQVAEDREAAPADQDQFEVVALPREEFFESI